MIKKQRRTAMKKIDFDFTRQSFMSGFDGKTCKVVPSIATDGKTVLIAYEKLLLTGSDVTVGSHVIKSTDGGKTFSNPIPQKNLADTYEGDIRRTYSGTVYYNKKLGKWFSFGYSHIYEHDKHPVIINGCAVVNPLYIDVDAEKGEFVNHRILDFPFDYISALSMGQIVECDDGDIIVPFGFFSEKYVKSAVVTVKYTFTEDGVKVVKAGTPISGERFSRGIGEPSLAKLGDKYYLTLRSDEIGLYAVSDDGFTFSEPKPYKWDDGSILENHNTQQHWMISENGLFLAYTRKGAHNDHVFRHRAPIFMSRFDEENECLVRDSEVILVPELGARLGNFCAIAPQENEAWLVTAEWMQSWNEKLGVCEKYGSNNSFWLAKVYFKN